MPEKTKLKGTSKEKEKKHKEKEHSTEKEGKIKAGEEGEEKPNNMKRNKEQNNKSKEIITEKKNKKNKKKLSRFFSELTRNKANIEKRKNELWEIGYSARKKKKTEEQECRLFFRIMNISGLNEKKLRIKKN